MKTESIRETFDRWEMEWKKEHPFQYFLDEKVLHNKTISGHRGSYALTHPWIIIEDIYHEVRYAFQRAFRGWDDRVIWSIDYYLADILPVWLMELKKKKQGIPSVFFTEEELSSSEGLTDDAMARAGKEYDDVLDKMALGFKSYNDKENCDYNSEEEKMHIKNFEEGFDLFRKYFDTLWD
jgi:hypothetical protein